MAEAVTAIPVSRRMTFLHNVIWGWAGVVVNLVIGILLSPIIIRKLGIEQYGVWVLLFTLLDYVRVLDFGFRAAVINACARARERQDWIGVSQTISSSLAYFLAAGVSCSFLAIVLRDVLIRAIEISPDLQLLARELIVLIAVTISIRLVMSPLTA